MELAQLQELVGLLRKLGVTKYECGDVKLELGLEPPQPVKPDLARDGFTPRTDRSPDLQRMLDRLDPAYSDPALFSIR